MQNYQSVAMQVEADKIASIAIGSDFSYSITVKTNKDQTAGIISAITMDEDTTQPEITVTNDKDVSVKSLS
jgi:hypothetical protein